MNNPTGVFATCSLNAYILFRASKGGISIKLLIDKSDDRMKYLELIMHERGYDASAYDGAVGECDALIVSPAKRPDALCEIMERMPRGATLAGGQKADEVYAFAKKKGVRYVNAADDEVFALKNAVATAEGALMLMLEKTDKVLQGAAVAIFGFGRIAKSLSAMLYALGVRVHVWARNPIDIANAARYGTHRLGEDDEALLDCEIVVNTVPARIISNKQLERLKKGTLLIELASSPYGFDAEYASKIGLNSIVAAGIPAKGAPYSAAVYLADSVENKLLEV